MTTRRRQHQRVSHSIPVKVQFVDRHGQKYQFEGASEDLSISGIGIRMASVAWGLLAAGMPARVMLRKGSSTESCPGSVVRVGLDDGVYRIGIQFDAPRPDVLAKVTRYTAIRVDLGEIETEAIPAYPASPAEVLEPPTVDPVKSSAAFFPLLLLAMVAAFVAGGGLAAYFLLK